MVYDWPQGMKIMCINVDPRKAPDGEEIVGGLDGLELKGVYTVRRVYLSNQTGNDPCVEVREIVRPVIPETTHEPGYNCLRFRPLVEDEKDVFEKMRTNIPSDEALKHILDWEECEKLKKDERVGRD